MDRKSKAKGRLPFSGELSSGLIGQTKLPAWTLTNLFVFTEETERVKQQVTFICLNFLSKQYCSLSMAELISTPVEAPGPEFVSANEAEDQRDATKLLSGPTSTLVQKEMSLLDIESKCQEASRTMALLMAQKEEMLQIYKDEIYQVGQAARDQLRKIHMEHQANKRCLEAQERELQNREKQLERRQAQNETLRRELHEHQLKIERAAIFRKKVDEKLMQLAEEQKRQKERFYRRFTELQTELGRGLQFEIERMRGLLQVMRHVGELDKDAEVKKMVDVIKVELEEKEKELECIVKLHQDLIIKESKSNTEFQDVRKELIDVCPLQLSFDSSLVTRNMFRDDQLHSMGIKELQSGALVGVKRIGELDAEAFYTATEKIFSEEEAEEKASELYSKWEDYLRDPSWHPFTNIMDKEGNGKEFINPEDEKLKRLREEYGNGVYQAVTAALMEINQYNPNGRYVIHDLWNFKEDRRASLREGIDYLLSHCRVCKRMKT